MYEVCARQCVCTCTVYKWMYVVCICTGGSGICDVCVCVDMLHIVWYMCVYVCMPCMVCFVHMCLSMGDTYSSRSNKLYTQWLWVLVKGW